MVKSEKDTRIDQLNQLAAYTGGMEPLDTWGLIDLLIEMGTINHAEAWWLMSERMVQEAD